MIFSQVNAAWSPAANTCVVTGTQPLLLNLLYFYTMSLDLVVLILTLVGLMFINARSSISKLLAADGVLVSLRPANEGERIDVQ